MKLFYCFSHRVAFLIHLVFNFLIFNFLLGNLFFIIIFAVQIAQKPSRGLVGGTADILFRKRLLDALSWLVETWKTSIVVKNETTVDALWYVYSSVA